MAIIFVAFIFKEKNWITEIRQQYKHNNKNLKIKINWLKKLKKKTTKSTGKIVPSKSKKIFTIFPSSCVAHKHLFFIQFLIILNIYLMLLNIIHIFMFNQIIKQMRKPT